MPLDHVHCDLVTESIKMKLELDQERKRKHTHAVSKRMQIGKPYRRVDAAAAARDDKGVDLVD